ncbi:MAG TPA: DegT/DnrJ/EryC1/StrS family aminotransferase [Phycisphaerae bacterium]|mgnify:FL=1|jgi:dTDP-4-amino-4,6-dideoxygalactose transaminase|nr:DegT/DnrJ/EryC1/StrS family aminotransferase [Phycisphaerae bacterium]HOB76467.1 DegT/DnrJ/EryC1/StrS family aminotransferase [Phycisphaerae bacterium]HOJ56524.1 DegT/DnrJ/EryC1/StrS family aminotransferase [Phycisphaerae bacterium]HOL28318.1 DegT/DnrJ/EryC1/StrS family aminotransferase [Phycisphaerae bacterium]HPP22712.1 DegT/DnrJ/EryC1/StrS family aminotransferase [Phycisphaerae bacterium]
MAEKLAIHGGKPVRSEPFPAWPVYGPEEERKLVEVLRSGKWGKQDGQEVATFERRFAEYCGARHGIAVNNGTISLQIALLAAGIKAGDEVIVPPYTFLATASAVLMCNAMPVFVDLDLDTWNIDPKRIEEAITPRTRAIIPVHFGGLPADMDAIMAIARRHNLIVIEDAAHAHGAEYKGRRCGSIGHFGSFSFQSSKNLTCGEGGIITTNDDELAAQCRSIHNCGRVAGGPWYEHHVIACNYRMNEFQGGLLNCQLDRLDDQIKTREANGDYLAERVRRIPGIIPQVRTGECTRHGYHLFLVRVDPAQLGMSRETFVNAVKAEGIPISPGYPFPLYRQPMFMNAAFGPYTGYQTSGRGMNYREVRCPQTETLCYEQGIFMVQQLLLGTRKDMDDIVAAFEKVYENRAELAKS